MAELKTGSVAAGGRGLWKRVAPLLVLTAEVSGLATFVGAFFSIIFNSIAFGAMGLSFVDIATPSDLLMSGIKLTGTLLLVVGGSVLVAAPIYFVFRRFRFIRDAKPLVWKMLFASALAVFFFGMFSEAAPWFGHYPEIPRDLEQTALLAYFPLLALAWILRCPEFARAWRMAGYVTIIVALAVKFGATIYDSYSFARSNLLVRFEGGEESCGAPSRAIWIGTSSIVVECATLNQHRDISVVERSTVEIIPREAYFARRGEALYAARRYFDPFKARDWRQIESLRDKVAGKTVTYPASVDVSEVIRDGGDTAIWVVFEIREALDSEGPVVLDVAVHCETDTIAPRAAYMREARRMTSRPPSEVLGEGRTLPQSLADVACRTDLQTLPKSDLVVPRTLGYPGREAAEAFNTN